MRTQPHQLWFSLGQVFKGLSAQVAAFRKIRFSVPSWTPSMKTCTWKSPRFSTGPRLEWPAGCKDGMPWEAVGCGGQQVPMFPQRVAQLRQRTIGPALNCFHTRKSEHAYSPLHRHNAHPTVHKSKQPPAEGRPLLLPPHHSQAVLQAGKTDVAGKFQSQVKSNWEGWREMG